MKKADYWSQFEEEREPAPATRTRPKRAAPGQSGPSAEVRDLRASLEALRKELAGMPNKAATQDDVQGLSAEVGRLREAVAKISGKLDAIAAHRGVKRIELQKGSDGRVSGATVTEEK